MLAIGGEAHVAAVQGHGLAAADGFFTQALHVERHLLLPLGNHHAAVKQPGLEHGAHALAQDLGADVLGPGAQGITLVIQHPDQAVGDVRGIGGVYIDGRFTDLAGIVQTQVGEISLAAWPACRLGHMQTQGGVLVHAFLRSLCLVFLLSFEAVAADTPACD
ncbi:hypothetical protein D3C79_634060 [compost metagenome]